MKKIIDQKTYDTDTAKAIITYEHGIYQDDLFYFTETLYQTEQGEYFLHGKGNAGSVYRKAESDNSWVCGQDIILIPEQAAQEFRVAVENKTYDRNAFASEYIYQPNQDNALQQQFQRIREAKGISRYRIDLEAGVAKGFTRRFEEGENNPTLATLQRMAALIGATLRFDE